MLDKKPPAINGQLVTPITTSGTGGSGDAPSATGTGSKGSLASASASASSPSRYGSLPKSIHLNCVVCDNVVPTFDKVSLDGHHYHSFCFKCHVCKRTLNLMSYGQQAVVEVAQDRWAPRVFCKQHQNTMRVSNNYFQASSISSGVGGVPLGYQSASASSSHHDMAGSKSAGFLPLSAGGKTNAGTAPSTIYYGVTVVGGSGGDDSSDNNGKTMLFSASAQPSSAASVVDVGANPKAEAVNRTLISAGDNDSASKSLLSDKSKELSPKATTVGEATATSHSVQPKPGLSASAVVVSATASISPPPAPKRSLNNANNRPESPELIHRSLTPLPKTPRPTSTAGDSITTGVAATTPPIATSVSELKKKFSTVDATQVAHLLPKKHSLVTAGSPPTSPAAAAKRAPEQVASSTSDSEPISVSGSPEASEALAGIKSPESGRERRPSAVIADKIQRFESLSRPGTANSSADKEKSHPASGVSNELAVLSVAGHHRRRSSVKEAVQLFETIHQQSKTHEPLTVGIAKEATPAKALDSESIASASSTFSPRRARAPTSPFPMPVSHQTDMVNPSSKSEQEIKNIVQTILQEQKDDVNMASPMQRRGRSSTSASEPPIALGLATILAAPDEQETLQLNTAGKTNLSASKQSSPAPRRISATQAVVEGPSRPRSLIVHEQILEAVSVLPNEIKPPVVKNPKGQNLLSQSNSLHLSGIFPAVADEVETRHLVPKKALPSDKDLVALVSNLHLDKLYEEKKFKKAKSADNLLVRGASLHLSQFFREPADDDSKKASSVNETTVRTVNTKSQQYSAAGTQPTKSAKPPSAGIASPLSGSILLDQDSTAIFLKFEDNPDMIVTSTDVLSPTTDTPLPNRPKSGKLRSAKSAGNVSRIQEIIQFEDNRVSTSNVDLPSNDGESTPVFSNLIESETIADSSTLLNSEFKMLNELADDENLESCEHVAQDSDVEEDPGNKAKIAVSRPLSKDMSMVKSKSFDIVNYSMVKNESVEKVDDLAAMKTKVDARRATIHHRKSTYTDHQQASFSDSPAVSKYKELLNLQQLMQVNADDIAQFYGSIWLSGFNNGFNLNAQSFDMVRVLIQDLVDSLAQIISIAEPTAVTTHLVGCQKELQKVINCVSPYTLPQTINREQVISELKQLHVRVRKVCRVVLARVAEVIFFHCKNSILIPIMEIPGWKIESMTQANLTTLQTAQANVQSQFVPDDFELDVNTSDRLKKKKITLRNLMEKSKSSDFLSNIKAQYLVQSMKYDPQLSAKLFSDSGALELTADGRAIVPLDQFDFNALSYRHHFYLKQHRNYMGTIDKLGEVILSMKREPMPTMSSTLDLSSSEFGIRIIFRAKSLPGQVIHVFVPEADVGGKSSKKSDALSEPRDKIWRNAAMMIHPKLDIIKMKEIKVSAAQMEEVSGQKVPSKIEKAILQLDEHRTSFNYKFGLLYVQDGQQDELEWFNNNETSNAFEKFFQVLGQVIPLKGHSGFAGGLDTKNGNTGAQAIYTKWAYDPKSMVSTFPKAESSEDHLSFEIMYHCSTLLPFSFTDEQQIQRKRHIGNDLVSLVFIDKKSKFNQLDMKTLFDPRQLKSQFLHVYIIVQEIEWDRDLAACSTQINSNQAKEREKTSQKCRAYRVYCTSVNEVPSFSPSLPEPQIFPVETEQEQERFRDFLTAKLINAENAAHYAPKFKSLHTRTSIGLVETMLREFAGSNKASHAAAVPKPTGKAVMMMQKNLDTESAFAKVAANGSSNSLANLNQSLDNLNPPPSSSSSPRPRPRMS